MSKLYFRESCLFAGVFLAIALSLWGPAITQFDNYHAFADQRILAGLPHAVDVLSNFPFAIAGLWGLYSVVELSKGQGWDTRNSLASVFFAGLVITAIASSSYHLAPDDLGLAWDRCGMVAAFAGLMGLAVADRISPRAGIAIAMLTLVAGPASVYVWATTGNLTSWAVLQGGGMLLVVVLSMLRPVSGAWRIPLFWVIACYAIAKALELGDHVVFEATQWAV
ncbi:MAG: hypothetical protein ACOVOD_04420, partial [Rhodoferax sp.]